MHAGKLAGQTGERDLELQPRQRRPYAEMDASPEADMGGVATTRIEPVGVREPSRIAIRGTEQHRDLLADRNGLTRDLDTVFEYPPFEKLEGSVPPDHLLNGHAGGDVSAHDAPPLVGMVQKRPHTVAERVDRGLVPSVQ